MGEPVDVTSVDQFRAALATLRNATHGDTLAIFLGLKWHQHKLPKLGETDGISTKYLEEALDFFYTKRHRQLDDDDGRVCFIFSERFKPASSNEQNNWRDVLPYKNGFSCLAPDVAFTPEFLRQSRSACIYLGTNAHGESFCTLHPKRPVYIRGLDKAKFLKWDLQGNRGAYRVTPLDNPSLLDYIRPLTLRVPLDALIRAVYFGAMWTRRQSVTSEEFAVDFGFTGGDVVEYLFATDVDDAGMQKRVASVKETILEKLKRPFTLFEPIEKSITVTEKRIRDRAFTTAVREVYDNSCAVCGLKLETPEGRFEVQAAHICPHAIGGADDVRNGISLCRIHHWLFEQFLFTISDDWKVIWHNSVTNARVRRDGMLNLPAGRRGDAWPAKEAVRWHRDRFEQKRS